MTRRDARPGRLAAAAAALVVAVAGCGAPILANDPVPRPTLRPATTASPRPADPQPVVLPRDDGPHDRLTEWWYYTGHLRTGAGERFGFEYVVFRAERGGFPVSWASHLALTDETGGRFHYAERSEIGPAADISPSGDIDPIGFGFVIRGLDPSNPAGAADAGGGATNGTAGAAGATHDGALPAPWQMTGVAGQDRLTAAAAAAEVRGDPVAGFGLDLRLRQERAPVLHDRDGWIDFGPAGGSYYYSRTRMSAEGTIELGDRRLDVVGSAWFDHQWGDFIAVGGGGWDWFAVGLEDGTDLTISLVRAADGSYPLVYGTLVTPAGTARHLDGDAFTVEPTGRWTSPATGIGYPSGWRIEVPGEALVIDLEPTVAAQELDTRATTGVVYWEGSQVVRATRAGVGLGGEAYVELTGYGEAGQGWTTGSSVPTCVASSRLAASILGRAPSAPRIRHPAWR